MNSFVSAINPTTANGAATLASSGSIFLDLFSMIGSASDSKQVLNLFDRAFQKDPALAIRIALWSRDCRGGAGRRLGYKAILPYLTNQTPDLVIKMLPNLVDYGRYDDILELVQFPSVRYPVAKFLLDSVTKNKLAAKWMPREKSANKHIAKILMKCWNMNSKEYRKFLVEHSDTVETKMCAKEYSSIVYSHVPSVAMARYQSAFNKNDFERFAEYKHGLTNGTTKVNASVLFPHDVVRTICSGQSDVANAQWGALPNYIPEGVSILPLVDVSGSMQIQVSGSIRAIDVSSSLGIYVAERQASAFKDVYLTFESRPKICTLPSGSFGDRWGSIMRAPWGGSTDFVAAIRLVLEHAINNEVDPRDMPQFLLCISDMEFNCAGNMTNFDAIKQMFDNSPYEMPKLVFWNVNSRSNNVQVKKDERGVSMISGFSPAILKSVLSCSEINPIDSMLETIMVSRYDIEGVTV